MYRYSKTPRYKDIANKLTSAYRGVVPETVTFNGSIKADGSNTSVLDSPGKPLAFQSRKHNERTQSNDTDVVAVFDRWCTNRLEKISDYTDDLRNEFPEYADHDMVIYGEFLGNESRDAVGDDSVWIIFAVTFITDVELFRDPKSMYKGVFVNYFELAQYPDMFDATLAFNTHIDVDVTRLSKALPDIAEDMSMLNECPLRKCLNKPLEINGEVVRGEGIVYKHITPDGTMCKFKVVNPEYSGVKAGINPDQLIKFDKATDWAKAVITESRVRQAVEAVSGNIDSFTKSDTGDVMRWIINDAITEEADGLAESGLDKKSVSKPISSMTLVYLSRLIPDDHKRSL